VHAMITSSATGTSFKAWEYVKTYYTTSAFHPKNVVVVNERAFQRLPEPQRKPVRELVTALVTALARAAQAGGQVWRRIAAAPAMR